MKVFSSKRVSDSCSHNRKSKTCPELCRRIQNRKLIVALAVAFAMCGAVALAQQPKKVPRIGYLSSLEPAREAARSEAMGLALRELGYIEGNNIVTEYRYAAGKVDRAPELASELVRLRVDIILIAGGPTQSQAAKKFDHDDSHCYDGRRGRSCRDRLG